MISPLLSNLYLHWFDELFHRDSGPAQWAEAKLVRYADDFVVLANDGIGNLSSGSNQDLKASSGWRSIGRRRVW